MAPNKKVPVTNVRKTGAKVPPSWNAKMMTSAKAAPKTGTIPVNRKPSAPTPKPASTPKTGVKVPAEWNAKPIYSGANKPRPGAPTTAAGRMAARGPLDAPGRPLQPNSTAKGVNLPKLYNWASRTLTADVRPANKPTAKPAAKSAASAAKPTAKPAAKPSGQFKAPSVPKPGTATKPQGTPQAQKWVKENTLNARVQRSLQAQNPVRRMGAVIAKAGKTKIGRGGAAVLGLQAASAVQDRFLSQKQLANKREFENYDAVGPMLKKLGIGGKPAAKGATPAASTSRFAGARDKAMAKAKGIKGSPVLGPKIVGPKKVGSGGGGGGTIAQAFDKSFAAARKAGKATFMFQGKKYTTEMK